MATPHDSLVKRVFSRREDAIGELRSALPPEVLPLLDLDRLELQNGSFYDRELVGRHADLLFRVPLRDMDEDALIYVLFEHQSTADWRMAFRLLQYMVRIWDRFLADTPDARQLPIILPLVLHHGEHGWSAPTRFHDLFASDVLRIAILRNLTPDFRFLVDDLAVATDEDLRARPLSTVAQVALWLLRDARFDRLERTFAAWTGPFDGLLDTPEGHDDVRAFFCYIFDVRGTSTAERFAARITHPRLRQAAMTIAEQLRQEGRDQGALQGRRALVAKQLTLKFGALDDDTRTRVAEADDATLDRLAERVLFASTIAEVFTN